MYEDLSFCRSFYCFGGYFLLLFVVVLRYFVVLSSLFVAFCVFVVIWHVFVVDYSNLWDFRVS